MNTDKFYDEFEQCLNENRGIGIVKGSYVVYIGSNTETAYHRKAKRIWKVTAELADDEVTINKVSALGNVEQKTQFDTSSNKLIKLSYIPEELLEYILQPDSFNWYKENYIQVPQTGITDC